MTKAREKQLTLLPDDQGRRPRPPEFTIVLKLLAEVTTLQVIGEFLKGKNLPFSAGSWSEMEETRLLPYLKDGKITIDDLKRLLAEAEEYGSSHVFLYTTPREKALELINEARIGRIAEERGLSDTLGLGKVLEQPATSTISSIRWEKDKRGDVLIIKIVERREERQFLGETAVGDSRIRREWDLVPIRAVSVLRLFSFGMLEIRITSHWSSTKYVSDILRVRKLTNPFFPGQHFGEYSLTKAKKALWQNRKKMTKQLRFNSSCLRTNIGGRLDAAGGDETTDMFQDPAVAAGVDAIWGSGAFCESSSVYWLEQEGSLPSREMHMLLSGQNNEFAITSASSKKDYECIFDQLRALA
jgi:hypothetical protein